MNKLEMINDLNKLAITSYNKALETEQDYKYKTISKEDLLKQLFITYYELQRIKDVVNITNRYCEEINFRYYEVINNINREFDYIKTLIKKYN